MNKKKLYLLVFSVIFFSLIFLSHKSYRYIGINGSINKIKISNYKKISEFYERHLNYKELVKNIIYDSKDKKREIIDLGTWVYVNIKKISNKNDIIDNHPWTIVERRVGQSDQFSDILSVLLVHNNVDSFFIRKFKNITHPLTFFKHNNKWSIIDPYYGVYFINDKNFFSTIEENKNEILNMQHLTLGKVTLENLDTIFFDKDFKNIKELNNYFNDLFLEIPNSKVITNTHMYKRGGRSYIQKPIHRILEQLRRFFNI